MKEIKKILCAVDLSEHSKDVAEYAVLLAKGLNASVVVVYTAPSLSQYVGFHVPPNTIENFVGEIVSGAETVSYTHLLARLLLAWIRLAITSLPVPDSPVMSTVASEAAMAETRPSTCRMAGLWPMTLRESTLAASS